MEDRSSEPLEKDVLDAGEEVAVEEKEEEEEVAVGEEAEEEAEEEVAAEGTEDFLDGDKLGKPVGKVSEAVLTGFTGGVDDDGGGGATTPLPVVEAAKEVVLTGDSGGSESAESVGV